MVAVIRSQFYAAGFEPREESLYQKVGASVISSAWATGRTFYSSAQKKHDALSSEEQCCSEDHTEGDEGLMLVVRHSVRHSNMSLTHLIEFYFSYRNS